MTAMSEDREVLPRLNDHLKFSSFFGKVFNEQQLKSLILAQIERWRHG
jgi:hypothetical protein|tara:strand:- start:702 stop:845 length:144 start_codon:yes stop_codon:yes gene_type:complete